MANNGELKTMKHLRYEEFYTGGNAGIFMKIKKMLCSIQSEYQRIDIFEHPDFGVVFALDGITMCTELDEFMYHEMLVHVPLFIHPEPKKVLVIGGGDGGSVREVFKHPSVEEVILCEIDPEVIEAAKKYLPTAVELNNPKLKIVNENGAEYVKSFENYFDAIILDSTDPTEGEGGHLFTESFYGNCFNALTEKGVFSAETEDPLYDKGWVSIAYNRIKSKFPITKLYTGFMTTYPSGMWTYTYASKKLDPINDFSYKNYSEFEAPLKYYNEEIHKACFALPNFVKELIGDK